MIKKTENTLKSRRSRLECISVFQKNRYSKRLSSRVEKVVEQVGFSYANINLSRSSKRDKNISIEKIQEFDIVIIDISIPSNELFYELGIAQANGKFIVYLVNSDQTNIPNNLRSYSALPYIVGKEDFGGLSERLLNELLKILRNPPKKSLVEVFPTNVLRQPHIIDLENLDNRTFENLSYELLVQMGYRQVEWEKSNRGIDIQAIFPKKDPDGYEYNEQWLVSINEDINQLENGNFDPEYYIHQLNKIGIRERYINDTGQYTFLFITKKSKSHLERKFIRTLEKYYFRRTRRSSREVTIRFRHWSLEKMTKLLQEYPSIINKYFSEDSKEGISFRKNYEILYKENISITEELQKAKTALEKEKELRFIAERDAAWKDVAFKAAHKLGNPIDAIDTFLVSLKKRILNDCQGALDIANEIDTSIEDAKLVIEQFKSLTKALNIKVSPTEIDPLINRASMPFLEKGIKVEISIRTNCPKIIGDENRLSECFQELFANSAKWFYEDEKHNEIRVKVIKPRKKNLPENLNSKFSYLKIIFSDNGQGIPYEYKEKIFVPFVSKSIHGTGLGLSLVQNIIEKHNGLIFEDGIPSKGANFNIFLPISK